MDAIHATNLSRQYAPGRGVCGVSLAVAPGECYGILGRNGSGKSTLMRLLVGLERPESGTLTVLGSDVAGGSRGHLARCGVALDQACHWQPLSGRQNAWFVARSCGLRPAGAARRVDKYLSAAGLADQADEPVATYSFGMRRKLSIVEALLHEPDLLVLDEPTAGVDPQFCDLLARTVRLRGSRGQTSFITGNDPEFLAGVADRVAFMEGGRIVAEAPPQKFLAEVAGSQEVLITLAAATALPGPADHLPQVRSFHQDGAEIVAVGADDLALVPRLLEWIVDNGAVTRTVEVRRPSLREAFLVRTGKGLEQ